MKSKSNCNLSSGISSLQRNLFAFMGAATITSVLAALYTEAYYLLILPFALLIGYVAVTDFRKLYFLLLFCLPFSMEFSITPALGTDLPDEPLMAGLMLVTIVYVLLKPRSLPTGFFSHVLLVGLVIHLAWILITALTSVNMLVSVKVFLSKLWYIATFTVLSAIVLKTRDDLKRAFWSVYLSLTVLIIVVIVRHGMQGFSFEDINQPMMPFFRNHVNYAAMVTIFLPWVWLVRQWYPAGTFLRRLLGWSLVLYVAAVYLSYTRTCYLALLFIMPFVWIVRRRFMKHAVAAVFLLITVAGAYLMNNNKYLDFAPDFEETIIHDEFGDHLSSTFEGKDVSSMERVYRWVAILQMYKDRPAFGFGPGNFYPYYMQYTVSSFETYVSDNPERSTAHNYFLLLLSEQGIPGMLIFLLFTALIFIYGETIYHRIRDPQEQKIALTLLVVLAMVYVNLLLSDLLESDKVGPFFFMSLGLLAALDIRLRSGEADA